MTKSYGPYEWRRHKEYYTEKNRQVTFKEDTPAEILESYRQYQEQIESLEDFAKNKGVNQLFSMLKPKEKTNSSQRGLAQRFVEYCNEGQPLPKNWFSFDFVYHDGHGNTQKADQIPVLSRSYRIIRCIDSGDKSMVFWKTEDCAYITVVTVKDNEIVQIRQYNSIL